MGRTKVQSVTHIRNDGLTVDGYWESLCLVKRPQSSISERHAREILAGRITQHVVPCKRCQVVLDVKIRTEEVIVYAGSTETAIG